MKLFLAVIWLFSISLSAQVVEERFTTLQRFGVRAEWNENQNSFPQVLSGLERQGVLTMVRIGSIESVLPYDQNDGRPVARPAIIDDLFYESLMLPDPVGGSERMYPLIAKAVRLPADLSYAVFELDPRVRFQDGTMVYGSDILFSLDQLKVSSPEVRRRIEAAVRQVSANAGEVRFDLNTRGQASRDILMLLAGMKIVKLNTTGATLVGRIAVPFTATGPYRITQLGRTRLGLIIDPSYWGQSLAVRRGFFNFRIVEVAAYPDEISAREALLADGANFFLESQLHQVRNTESLLIPSNPNLLRIDEKSAETGALFSSYAFNLNSAETVDRRFRAALLLTYDFEAVNAMFYGGVLERPDSLLTGSQLAPSGRPSAEVKSIMDTCTPPEVGPFEEHGHSKYRAIGGKRMRLLTAMRLLQEAGYKIENGALKRPLPDGTYVPVSLRLLAHENEVRAAQIFKADLQRMGIALEITAVSREAFRTLQAQGQYDLISVKEGFLTADGWPSAQALQLTESQSLPCIQAMVQTLEKEPAYTNLYRDTAEALARIHQALQLSIFRGDPARKTYFKDRRLAIPDGLSNRRIHLYGYWNEPAPIEQPPYGSYDNGYGYGFPPAWNNCASIACFFNELN